MMDKQFVLLVGTTKGLFLFRADHQRRDWRMEGPYLGGQEIYSVLGDSRQKPRIYVGVSNDGKGPTIQVSDDFGANWRPIAAPPRYPEGSNFQLSRIWQLVAGPTTTPAVLYAGVEEAGLFVSHDQGEHWSELSGLTQHPTRPGWIPGAGGMGLHTILLDPSNPRRLWVAISAAGVFRSDDRGETWQTCNKGLARVPTGQPYPEVGYCAHKVTLDPQDSNILYMQDHGGVNKSTDAGDTWFPIEEGLLPRNDERFGFPICAATTGDLFLVPLEGSEQRQMRGGKLLIYRSQNRGESWAPVGDVSPESSWVSVLRDGLTVDTLEPYGVYFGTTGGELFYSLERGDSWVRLPGRLPRITAVKTWIVEQ
jgi:hypothetical protein